MTHTMSDRPRRTRPARAPRALLLVALVVADRGARLVQRRPHDRGEGACGGRHRPTGASRCSSLPSWSPRSRRWPWRSGGTTPTSRSCSRRRPQQALRKRIDGGAQPEHLDRPGPASSTPSRATRGRRAPAFDVGNNVLQFVVRNGNPKRIHSLAVFGPDGGPYPGARTGMCKVGTLCGSSSSKFLAQQKIDASPDHPGPRWRRARERHRRPAPSTPPSCTARARHRSDPSSSSSRSMTPRPGCSTTTCSG